MLADRAAEPKETTVNLRVEGKNATIFEGTVSTCGHRVTTKTGGTRHCDGTNNDNNPCAGPTCTTALDDANKVANFGFDGYVIWCALNKDCLAEETNKTKSRRAFFQEFDDFLITTIGNETPKGEDYWALCLNSAIAPVGGCQQKVKKDDEVLFAYATLNVTKYFLKLYGPKFATINQPVVLTVSDGKGTPIQNANVNGKKTDADGHVSLTFHEVGTQLLKAEKSPDSVRSNQLVINVVA